MTGHKNMQRKLILLSLFLLTVLLCGAIFFAASNAGNPTVFTPEDMLLLQSIDLGNELERLDKINEANVLITASGNEIDRVYITITLAEELVHPEADNIIEFVSDYFEELDKRQIFISYLDSSFNELVYCSTAWTASCIRSGILWEMSADAFPRNASLPSTGA